MMSSEEKLKNLILSKHKSVREFASIVDLPPSTVNSILERGIANAGVGNAIKICKHFGISLDKLVEGKIEPSENIGEFTAEEQRLIAQYRLLDDVEQKEISGHLEYVFNKKFLQNASSNVAG